jgi:hypothetical protein
MPDKVGYWWVKDKWSNRLQVVLWEENDTCEIMGTGEDFLYVKDCKWIKHIPEPTSEV